MTGWASLLTALFSSLFDAMARAFLAHRADQDRITAHETIGALTAANETKDAINDMAQAQADLAARPRDVLDIARELRAGTDAAEPGGAGRAG
jgi:hypothetical protein